jgi:hypothetical protein
MVGCTAINPKPEQLQLPTEPPAVRETSFSEALRLLGVQSEIFGARMLKIQSREMDDVTGTSYHTGGEIPKSITIMVNTALNAIGGNVVFIPFWPDYFAGIHVAGYPVSERKLVPDVILTGGITEFDRGLTTLDRRRNFEVQTKELEDATDFFDNQTIGLDYDKGDKFASAKIAVDFNLVSYQALCGIPKMQSSNGVTVYKGVTEEELGFTLFGPTIGLRGSVKKVQGRHDAVRLLVQFSVIQLVGRYMDLPYWQLLDGAQPDPVVIDTIKSNYALKSPVAQALLLKRLLWIHGQPVPVTTELDAETRDALVRIDPTYDGLTEPVPVETYLKLYLSLPVTTQSLERAGQIDQLLEQLLEIEAEKAQKDAKAQPPQPTQQQPEKKEQPLKEEKPVIQEQPSKPEAPIKKDTPKGKKPEKTKPPKQTPKPDVIIITPLNAQTHSSLKRIVRRIEDKHNNQSTSYQMLIQNTEVVSPAR